VRSHTRLAQWAVDNVIDVAIRKNVLVVVPGLITVERGFAWADLGLGGQPEVSDASSGRSCNAY